jgi:hypothetical protein
VLGALPTCDTGGNGDANVIPIFIARVLVDGLWALASFGPSSSATTVPVVANSCSPHPHASRLEMDPRVDFSVEAGTAFPGQSAGPDTTAVWPLARMRKTKCIQLVSQNTPELGQFKPVSILLCQKSVCEPN